MGHVAERPLVDSDVLIDYLRGRGPGRDLLAMLGPVTGYLISAVSAFELALARSYQHDPAPVDVLLAAPCLPLTRSAGVRAGALLSSLRAKGQAIDIRDAMQAGICVEAGATLVTRNIDHFRRVPGLRVVHPERWRAS